MGRVLGGWKQQPSMNSSMPLSSVPHGQARGGPTRWTRNRSASRYFSPGGVTAKSFAAEKRSPPRSASATIAGSAACSGPERVSNLEVRGRSDPVSRVSLEQQVAASAWVFDFGSWLSIHSGDQREARGGQLGGHFVWVKEVPIEFDMLPEPVGDVIYLTGCELGTVHMERD
jgi:hypothetical protein